MAEEATAAHPDVESLWKLLFRLVPEEEFGARIAILEAALDRCCSSEELWASYFETHLSAVERFGPETYPVNEQLFLDSLRKLGSMLTQSEADKSQRDRVKGVILKHLVRWAFQAGGIAYVRSLEEKVADITCLSVDFYREWIRLELSHYHDHQDGDKHAPKDQAMLDAFRSLFDQRRAKVASDTFKRVVALYESMVDLVPSDITIWLEYLAFLFTTGSPHQSSALLNRAKTMLAPLTYAQLEKDYIDYQSHRALESS